MVVHHNAAGLFSTSVFLCFYFFPLLILGKIQRVVDRIATEPFPKGPYNVMGFFHTMCLPQTVTGDEKLQLILINMKEARSSEKSGDKV